VCECEEPFVANIKHRSSIVKKAFFGMVLSHFYFIFLPPPAPARSAVKTRGIFDFDSP
jgi:hypothetical protein